MPSISNRLVIPYIQNAIEFLKDGRRTIVEASGVSQPTLSRIMTHPDEGCALETVQKLALICDIDVERLIEQDKRPQPEPQGDNQ